MGVYVCAHALYVVTIGSLLIAHNMSSANVHCERDLAHPDNPQRNEAGTHLLLDQGHQLR